jgi:hypothetical protein
MHITLDLIIFLFAWNFDTLIYLKFSLTFEIVRNDENATKCEKIMW